MECLIRPEIDLNRGRSKIIRATANVGGQAHQVSVRLFVKGIEGRWFIHDQCSGAIRPVTTFSCKGQRILTMTAFACSDMAAVSNAMTRALVTFRMRIGKSLQVPDYRASLT